MEVWASEGHKVCANLVVCIWKTIMKMNLK